jgi:hypothetical protein
MQVKTSIVSVSIRTDSPTQVSSVLTRPVTLSSQRSTAESVGRSVARELSGHNAVASRSARLTRVATGDGYDDFILINLEIRLWHGLGADTPHQESPPVAKNIISPTRSSSD